MDKLWIAAFRQLPADHERAADATVKCVIELLEKTILHIGPRAVGPNPGRSQVAQDHVFRLPDPTHPPFCERQHEAVEPAPAWPWTLDDLPMMAQWLEANSPALDLVGRAVCKPEFRVPLVRRNASELIMLDIAYLDEVPRFRSFARGLHARANHALGRAISTAPSTTSTPESGSGAIWDAGRG